jgi:hypothetical protein
MITDKLSSKDEKENGKIKWLAILNSGFDSLG